MVGTAPALDNASTAPRPAPPQPTTAALRPRTFTPARRNAPTTPTGSVVYARQPDSARTSRLVAPVRLADLVAESASRNASSLNGATTVAPPKESPSRSKPTHIACQEPVNSLTGK